MVCKGNDQPCSWFEQENVVYDDPQCQLDSNIHEITVVIKGRRKAGHGNLHKFELVLSEQGKPFCIEIAQKTSRSGAFRRGKYTKTGSIRSDETLTIIFLVQKTDLCPSSPHKVNVTCTLKHMHTGLNIWCSSVHKVSLVLTVV